MSPQSRVWLAGARERLAQRRPRVAAKRAL